MKRTPINPISQKQKLEIARRIKLKRELIEEYGEVCMTCGIHPSFPPIALSHIYPLGRGGKTSRENCLLECNDCHDRFEKKPEQRIKSQI